MKRRSKKGERDNVEIGIRIAIKASRITRESSGERGILDRLFFFLQKIESGEREILIKSYADEWGRMLFGQ